MQVSPNSRIFLKEGIDAYNRAISMIDPQGNYANAVLFLTRSLSDKSLPSEERGNAEIILKYATSKLLYIRSQLTKV